MHRIVRSSKFLLRKCVETKVRFSCQRKKIILTSRLLLACKISFNSFSLSTRCEEIIRQGVSVENVAMLYSTAIRFQATELEKFCFKFCLNHMTAVTQTEAFLSLEETILKDFITKAAIQGAFKS